MFSWPTYNIVVGCCQRKIKSIGFGPKSHYQLSSGANPAKMKLPNLQVTFLTKQMIFICRYSCCSANHLYSIGQPLK